MRRFLLAAAVLALAAACSNATSSSPEVDGGAVEMARLNTAVATVAEEQSEADPLLADHLEALRRLDAIIEELRDPEQVDAAKGRWQAVAEALEVVDVEALRTAYREVAFAVDEARVALAEAREDVDGGWESDYFTAQDGVLGAVREHARAADALAQMIGAHWGMYRDLRDITATFVEQRWFYRTPLEAADAYELEIKPHLEQLREARSLVARYTAERDDAAVAVNQATAEAAAVWASRPADASAETTDP